MPSERIAENLVTELGGSLFVNLGRPQIQEQAGIRPLAFKPEQAERMVFGKRILVRSRWIKARCIAAGNETRCSSLLESG